MNHGLFITEQVVAQRRILFEGLPDAGHITVAEDSQASGEESGFLAVSLNMLAAEEGNDRLCNRQASGHKDCHQAGRLELYFLTMGRRGSGAPQAERIQL